MDSLRWNEISPVLIFIKIRRKIEIKFPSEIQFYWKPVSKRSYNAKTLLYLTCIFLALYTNFFRGKKRFANGKICNICVLREHKLSRMSHKTFVSLILRESTLLENIASINFYESAKLNSEICGIKSQNLLLRHEVDHYWPKFATVFLCEVSALKWP